LLPWLKARPPAPELSDKCSLETYAPLYLELCSNHFPLPCPNGALPVLRHLSGHEITIYIYPFTKINNHQSSAGARRIIPFGCRYTSIPLNPHGCTTWERVANRMCSVVTQKSCVSTPQTPNETSLLPHHELSSIIV
jgi:hypothetical protein